MSDSNPRLPLVYEKNRRTTRAAPADYFLTRDLTRVLRTSPTTQSARARVLNVRRNDTDAHSPNTARATSCEHTAVRTASCEQTAVRASAREQTADYADAQSDDSLFESTVYHNTMRAQCAPVFE